jgi:hypothetical protein
MAHDFVGCFVVELLAHEQAIVGVKKNMTA